MIDVAAFRRNSTRKFRFPSLFPTPISSSSAQFIGFVHNENLTAGIFSYQKSRRCRKKAIMRNLPPRPLIVAAEASHNGFQLLE
jgi:hypothetical protein